MVKAKVKVKIGSWGPPTDVIKQYEEMVAKKLQIEEALKQAEENLKAINEFTKKIEAFAKKIETAEQQVDNIGNNLISTDINLSELEADYNEHKADSESRFLSVEEDLSEKTRTMEKFENNVEEIIQSVASLEVDISELIRPTETKTFLNDFSYEPNMDISSVFNQILYISAIRDVQNDLSGKEIIKIELNFDGDESNWVDIKDLIHLIPDSLYIINANRSFQYTDELKNDTVCFGVLWFINATNAVYTAIQNQNQYGFRVTYYTD